MRVGVVAVLVGLIVVLAHFWVGGHVIVLGPQGQTVTDVLAVNGGSTVFVLTKNAIFRADERDGYAMREVVRHGMATPVGFAYNNGAFAVVGVDGGCEIIDGKSSKSKAGGIVKSPVHQWDVVASESGVMQYVWLSTIGGEIAVWFVDSDAVKVRKLNRFAVVDSLIVKGGATMIRCMGSGQWREYTDTTEEESDVVGSGVPDVGNLGIRKYRHASRDGRYLARIMGGGVCIDDRATGGRVHEIEVGMPIKEFCLFDNGCGIAFVTTDNRIHLERIQLK